jgi:hypothetical protein
MQLPGRLSASTLGDLLGALHREGVTGLLELSEVRGPRGAGVPGRLHHIHLRGGLVVAVDTALPGLGLRGRLDAVFSIEEATVAFRTARPIAKVERPLTPREFLHGRPRARDRGKSMGSGPRVREHEETPPPRSGVRPVADDPRTRALNLLGLPPSAGDGDVRRAFRKLASALHPDKLGAAPPEERRRMAARFAELSAAYHLLVA